MSAIQVERRLRPRGEPIAEAGDLPPGAADLRRARSLGELVEWLAAEQHNRGRAAARVRAAEATIAMIEGRIIADLAGAAVAAVAGGRVIRVETIRLAATPASDRRVIRVERRSE